MNPAHKFLTLVRREVQENKSLWIAPLVVAGLMVVGVFFGTSQANFGSAVRIQAPPAGESMATLGANSLVSTATMFALVAVLVLVAYLLDCLHAERKDRSILFWKSLPVSDAETVLSKLFVAMVLVPVGVMLLSMAMQLVLGVVLWLRFEPLRDLLSIRMMAGWPAGIGRMVLAWLYLVLWYLPVMAYLMLASVLARRAPLVYAVLPPLVLVIWEAWMLDGSHIRTFLAERFLLVQTGMGPPFFPQRLVMQWSVAFSDPKLWAGVAVGAGMLYTVVRLRRYRDDT